MTDCDTVQLTVPDDDFMNFLFSDLPEQDIFGSFFDSAPQPAAEVAYSNTQQLNPDSGSVAVDESNSVILYPGYETLFHQPLILLKNFRNVADIRYKTDYFPKTGKNANIPQDPRYLLMDDESQEVVIKFPEGFIPPPQLGHLHLRVASVTVEKNGQHYLHIHKFQRDNSNPNVLDVNPFSVPITEQHFQQNEIRIKLVPIRTHQNEWKNLANLPLLDGNGINENGETQCKSKKELVSSYNLGRLMVAFTLGYIDSQNQFIAFTNTTVFSNEISDLYYVNKEPSEIKEVECPNCAHHFNINVEETKKKRKKSSELNLKPTQKKRSRS